MMRSIVCQNGYTQPSQSKADFTEHTTRPGTPISRPLSWNGINLYRTLHFPNVYVFPSKFFREKIVFLESNGLIV